MRIKCDFCGSMIDDTAEKCPNCGAVNEHMARSAAGIPKTIEELKAYCTEHQMPLEKMRFFIGEDYRGARAFGIYKDGEKCIVYKNKSDGSRAVRYEGPDEAYAVNEIFQKLKEESIQQIQNGNLQKKQSGQPDPIPTQPLYQTYGNNGFRQRKSVWPKILGIFLAIFFVPQILMTGLFMFSALNPFSYLSGSNSRGEYYQSGNTFYYNQGDDWYYYDDYDNSWYDAGEQYFDDDYKSSYDEFTDTYGSENAYADDDDSWWDSGGDSSWDNDSDWDSGWDDSWDNDYDYGGWDSGTSDWDSDW